MKKTVPYLILLFVSCSTFLYAEKCWDPLIPKINHGTLTEVSFDDLPNILNLSMKEILSVGSKEQRATNVTREMGYEYTLVPAKAYYQTIEGTDIEVYRVIIKITADYYYNCYYGYQKIFYKDTDQIFKLCYEDMLFYKEIFDSENGTYIFSTTLIIKNNELCGLFINKLYFFRLGYGNFMETIPNFNTLLKQRAPSSQESFFGDKTNCAYVYFFTENKHHVTVGWAPDITISASIPLIDAYDPFRYTIQNAFDQNPATSYVEDTDDDLMEINMMFSDSYRKGIHSHKGSAFIKEKIINGFAQNKNLYMQNNRIKTFWNIFLKDNCLNYQKDSLCDSQDNPWIVEYGFVFEVTDIYKGSKYNDTCLAELDFQYKNGEWLFGGNDE